MRFLAAVVVLYTVALAGAPEAAEDAAAGVRHLSVPAPERSEPLSVTVWYPAGAGGKTVRIGENGVFRGVVARQDAPMAQGTHPVVLVSHGGMRAAPNLAGWLDKALAERGFVVADVSAPQLKADDAKIAPAEIWKRPADLSAALTALESDRGFADHLDKARIGAVGFFLGGTSVLQLAGVRLDAEKYHRSCDKGRSGPDCAWYAKAGVDLRNVDPAKITRSNLDPRVRIAVAVAPELIDSLATGSLMSLHTPVDMVGLGSSSSLSGSARAIAVHVVRDATMFSAFNLCRPKGAAILAESGSEPDICRSDTAVGRERIHVEIVELVGNLLQARLAQGR